MAATRLLVALAMASGAFAQEMFCWMQAPVDATTGGPAARVQIPCPAGINVSISNPWATMQNCLFPIAVNWTVTFAADAAVVPNTTMNRGYTMPVSYAQACWNTNTATTSEAEETLPCEPTAPGLVPPNEYASLIVNRSEIVPKPYPTYTIADPLKYNVTLGLWPGNMTMLAVIQFTDSAGNLYTIAGTRELTAGKIITESGFSTGAIIAIVLVSVLALAAIAAALFFYLRARKLRKEVKRLQPRKYPKGMPPPVEDLELLDEVRENHGFIPRSQFIAASLVGQGEFGQVWKGALFKDGKAVVVAIKTLRDDHKDKEGAEVFLREAEIMKKLKHPNVVTLVGVSESTSDEPACILLEFLGLGDLRSYVMQHNLSTGERLWHCSQIARGMAYLSSQGLVHRDLAARNCMLASPESWSYGYPVAKIADFGLARNFDNDDSYIAENGGLLPIRWLAIECITDRKFTECSDVWAYGVTCWEVFSDGEVPYANVNTYNLAASIAAGTRLAQPAVCSDPTWSVIRSCWDQEPNSRPRFSELSERMHGLFKDLGDKGAPACAHAQGYNGSGDSQAELAGASYEDLSKTRLAKVSNGLGDEVYLDMSLPREDVGKKQHKSAGLAKNPSAALAVDDHYDDPTEKAPIAGVDGDDANYTYMDYMTKYGESRV